MIFVFVQKYCVHVNDLLPPISGHPHGCEVCERIKQIKEWIFRVQFYNQCLNLLLRRLESAGIHTHDKAAVMISHYTKRLTIIIFIMYQTTLLFFMGE